MAHTREDIVVDETGVLFIRLAHSCQTEQRESQTNHSKDTHQQDDVSAKEERVRDLIRTSDTLRNKTSGRTSSPNPRGYFFSIMMKAAAESAIMKPCPISPNMTANRNGLSEQKGHHQRNTDCMPSKTDKVMVANRLGLISSYEAIP